MTPSRRRLGATIVHVTHDQVEALTLADRIVVLNQGVVQQVGTPQELYNQPTNTFVASFIGSPSMNLILHWEGHTLGVRPEDIELGAGPVQARVDVLESLGGEALVHLEMDRADALVARVKEPAGVTVGETVSLSFRQVHQFDSQSGVRLS